MAREQHKEHEKRLRMVEQKESFKRANEDLIRLTQVEKAKELVEMQKIEVHAQKKEALEQLRKDKEEQRFLEKQQTRQKLVDRQIEHLKSLKNREDEILNKQVSEAEEKASRLFEEQERKRFEMK